MNRNVSARRMLGAESSRMLNPAAAPLIDGESMGEERPQQIEEAAPPAARAVLALLERLRHGRLTVVTPAGRTMLFGAGEPHATIRLSNWNIFGASLAFFLVRVFSLLEK